MRVRAAATWASIMAFGTLVLAGSAFAAEAPTGYDGHTNGYEDQATFEADRAEFSAREGVDDGLGPIYNAEACAECHRNPVVGGASQIAGLRAAHFDGHGYHDAAGGSLIDDRAIVPELQEHASVQDNVQTLRMTLSALGDGYVEAIPDDAIRSVQAHQPRNMKGMAVEVPVPEAPGTQRIGRFGWKAQLATLVSFAADAYLNEMGITSPLLPEENTSNGRSVADFDQVPDPEDEATDEAPFGADIAQFVGFLRSTKAPPRDAHLAGSAAAHAGEQVFAAIGCAHCHTPSFTTAAPGTVLNGGTFVVPEALGNKVIHPYSDFMLHDVGTGDGIIQVGGAETRNKLRTPPLWGLRTRPRLMHDGASLTVLAAILRHAKEADPVVHNFAELSDQQRKQLMTFLRSL